MKTTEQTIQQIERLISKIANKYPVEQEANTMTDIHLRVTQETGELMAYDDDEKEITRCVVEQWIDNKDDDFYQQISTIIQKCIKAKKEQTDNLSILKPYSFVLETDDKDVVAELYLADDDIVILNEELMADLDKDLDEFLNKLLKD